VPISGAPGGANHLGDDPPDGATTFLDALLQFNGDGHDSEVWIHLWYQSTSANTINRSFFILQIVSVSLADT
jgi:hypothetical protein